MADNTDPPPPRSQCLPSPPGGSRFELMPTEVLEKIFEELSQNHLQSLDDLEDDDLLEANRSAHTNMRNLCLTSKPVDAVARPLLFRTITVSSPATLLRLYETLPANEDLGCYIRQISFEIICEKVGPWDFLPARPLQCQSLLTGWDEEIARSNREFFNEHCCDQILSSCYFEILRRTPKVHQLVIRIQPIRQRGHTVYMYRPFFKRVRRAVQASLMGEGSEFLPRLTTLQLLGDPNDHSNLFDITVCEPLLRIPNLRTIKTFRDNGFWSGFKAESSGTAKSDRAFMNLRVAELQQSALYSHDFRALGVVLADVEVLKISSPADATWMMFSDGARLKREQSLGEGIAYLQEALTRMKNLQTLSLDFTYNAFWKGTIPTKRAPILTSLPKLETVSAPLQMLVEDCRDYRRNPFDRLAEVFPTSLKRLDLKVDIYCSLAEFVLDADDLDLSNDTCGKLLERLLDFVESLTNLGHDAFPYLQEVMCCYRIRGHYGVVHPQEEAEIVSVDFEGNDLFGIDFDFFPRLEQLRASLQQQQIRFTVAYERVECTDC